MTLATKDLGYWYENSGPLFENVNLTFEKGKMYAILGTSGSGKTTFLSLIAGLDTPKSGEILYGDASLKKSACANTVVKMSRSSFKPIIYCRIYQLSTMS